MDYLQQTLEDARRLVIALATTRHAIEEHRRHQLTARETRIMRHFWNPKLKEVRKTLPAEVIMFLESEYEDPGAEHHVRERTTQDLVTLIGRRYIKLIEQGGQIALDVDGIEWLAREYPRVVRWWQKALERTPTAAQILVGGIGFLSAGWDVIQLTLWLATRK